MERKDPYNCMCTVTVTAKSSVVLEDNFPKPGDKREPEDEGTCSGIIIDSQKGLVLTHASLIYPLATKIKKQKLQCLRQTGVAHGNLFKGGIQTTVLLPSQDLNNGKSGDSQVKDKKGNYNPAVLNCNFDEEFNTLTYNAKLKSVFECRPLKRTLHRMMPNDSWQFIDSVNTSNDKAKSLEDEELFYHLLPCFVLFQLKNWEPFESDLLVKKGLSNHLGDPIEICATPFGGLNPEVFLNSRARGIISNMAGPRNVLLLTDARCVPGSEGGALFYCKGKQRILTGMIIASLCWKNNEWVGLTMACAISELLGELEGILLKLPDSYNTSSLQSYSLDSVISRFISLVPVVQVGNTWGSGVLIDPGQGVVLTCSHVLKGSDHLPVKVRLESGDCYQKLEAQIVYKCQDMQQFDLGVLKIAIGDTDIFNNNSKRCLLATDVKEGEIVYVIGHAIFGADLDLSPTVTIGIVSKVNKIAKIPVLIQTTCAVHAGASGGAVINQQGQLVAIVVCNSKDTLSGACYPHVNMCVPIATIEPILKQYLKTEDSSILKALQIRNTTVHQLWSIGSPALFDVTSHL